MLGSCVAWVWRHDSFCLYVGVGFGGPPRVAQELASLIFEVAAVWSSCSGLAGGWCSYARIAPAEEPRVGDLFAKAIRVCLCWLLAAVGLGLRLCASCLACFCFGGAGVGGTEAPWFRPWAGGRSGCGDPRDRVLHIGQCEAEWGGWGALGSGRGDAPHQSPCLPSCEGLHGTWCLKLFLNFCLKVEQSIFAFFHEMVDGGRAHEFVASSWQLEGGYHSYERPLCPRAAACEVHDAY